METLSNKTIAMLKGLLDMIEAKGGIGGNTVIGPTALHKAINKDAQGPFWDKDAIKEGIVWCEKEGFPALPAVISVADDIAMQNREITKMLTGASSLAPTALKDLWKAEVGKVGAMDADAVQAVRSRLHEVEDTANASKKSESRRALANARVQNVEVSDFEAEYAWACDLATKYARCLVHEPEDVPADVTLADSRFNKDEEGYKDDFWDRASELVQGALAEGDIVSVLQQTLDDNQANWITKTYGGVNLREILEKRSNGVVRFERETADFYAGNTTSEHFFNFAQEMIGGQYPVIAHLMFLKDKDQFIPVKPTYFEAGLKRLGIEFYLSNCCSWDNYTRFLGYLEQIRQQLVAKGENPRLLDAHSFLWYIGSGYWRDGEGAKRLQEACAELSIGDVE